MNAKGKSEPSSRPGLPARPQGRWRALRAVAAVLAPLAILASAWAVWEARKPVQPKKKPTDRVTDVAPSQTPPLFPMDLNGEPHDPTASVGSDPSVGPMAPSPQASAHPPHLFPDHQHPPQWTEPRAGPAGDPTPPDPNVPPPMEIDPSTGRAPDDTAGGRR